jgi:hypothetical protein
MVVHITPVLRKAAILDYPFSQETYQLTLSLESLLNADIDPSS